MSKIISKIQLNDYKKYYLSIRNKIDRYPHILFILFTPPPLRASLTNKNYAKRAGFFSKWLISKDYISKRRNIKIFDFFSLLAEDLPIEKTYNTLREKYCRTNYFDSHPNRRANEEIGEIFTNFLFQSVRDFFSF
ncbi:hypothetical protein HY041_01365 [Candidatus Roizmanbacteria bacterium]|nr:hypothetical protein [Candidatus Roizmanbacteria bacterium]